MGPKKHPLQTPLDQARDEAARAGSKVCECGASISLRATRCTRCAHKARAARYRKTEKYRIKQARNQARYKKTEKRKATNARSNARRIKFGGFYRGKAQTVEQAASIKAHIKKRVHEFIARFSDREKAEGVSAGTVSPQAAV